MPLANGPTGPHPGADPRVSAAAADPDRPTAAQGRLARRVVPRVVAAGYTLVELAVAVVIVGLLASLAAPEMKDYVTQARITRATADIRTLSKEIEQHRIREGGYPESLDEIDRGGFEDPWGHPYRYLKIAGTGKGAKGKGGSVGDARKDRFLVPLNTDYDLYSAGPDGKSQPPLTAAASWDDVVRASDGEFVGPAAEY